MEKRSIHEFAGLVLLMAIIALVINFLRVMVFGNADFSIFIPRFLHSVQTENQTELQVQHPVRVQNRISGQSEEAHVNNPSINHDVYSTVSIPLESPRCLNFMSKEEVLGLRREAIETSPIFSNMDYSPDSEVFRIVDGKPWISIEGALNFSQMEKSDITQGVSRESIGILNPELIYYLSITEMNEDIKNGDFAPLYQSFDYIPYNVSYNPQTNTITTRYSGVRMTSDKNSYQPILLADTNAHDLGYKYAFMSQSDNIGIYEVYKNNSLKKDIKDITGWYMCGPACGVEGGCNNYAPYWQYYNNIYLKSLPASFNIKLWKEKPASTEQKADINFKMVFE